MKFFLPCPHTAARPIRLTSRLGQRDVTRREAQTRVLLAVSYTATHYLWLLVLRLSQDACIPHSIVCTKEIEAETAVPHRVRFGNFILMYVFARNRVMKDSEASGLRGLKHI